MRSELTIPALDPARCTAARVAGALYLVQMATGIFGFWAKGQVVVPDDAAQTAANLVTSERLFRLGIASDLVTAVTVIALAAALYFVLEPVNRSVALLAAFWRLAENAIAAAATLNGFLALRLSSGVSYLNGVDPEQLQSMARLFVGIQGQGLLVAFVFLGLGSAAFSYLWFRSGYIPRVLAVWGIFSSLVLSSFTLAIIVFPPLGDLLGMIYMAPMGIYEVTLGVWLLVKGIQRPIAR